MDIKWLLEKRIIHRGMIDNQCIDHAKSSYLECLKYSYPLEVDLLVLADGEIVVWRDGKLSMFGIKDDSRLVSSLTIEELKVIISREGNIGTSLEQMMTLKDFLDLIDGKLGLLIEIKEPYNSIKIHEHVVSILSIIEKYKGTYAIHSANPFVLQEIRKLNDEIPIGQISWSFETADVSVEYKDLHQQFKYFDIVIPDFLGYDIRELKHKDICFRVKKNCEKYGLPLIAWTVRNRIEEHIAAEVCDNMIIEGAISYIA